ncbi:MAG: MFS transporter [Actinobacteria bacterium]|nr:MFS transporter [Actinomycetota bacterium]
MHEQRDRIKVSVMVPAVLVPLSAVIPAFLVGTMAVQFNDVFGVGPAQIGLGAAAFAIGPLLFAPVMGRSVGRMGISTALRTAVLLSLGGMICAAIAPTFTVIAAAMFLAGLGSAFAHPAANALVAAGIPEGRFGIAFAIKQSAIPLGMMVAGLAVPLIAESLGFRWTFAVMFAFPLLALATIPSHSPTARGRSEGAIPRDLKLGAWLVAFGVAFGAFAASALATHAVSGAVATGMTASAAGYLVFGAGLFGLSVRLVAGSVADRVRGRALLATAALLAVGSVGWILMSGQTVFLFIIGILVANGFGWGWPGLYHLALARRFPTATAAATGIALSGISSGMLLGPSLVGLLADVNWTFAWLACAAVALIGACVLLLAERQLEVADSPSRRARMMGPSDSQERH